MYKGNSLATVAEPSSQTKTCPKCRYPLPIKEFDPNSARRDGLQSHCRKCRKRHRDLLARNGNGHSNGHGRSNGNGSRKHEDEAEEKETGGYTPTWRKPKVSRKELLLQRERYMNIINAASLALERIEMRLGMNPAEAPVETEREESEPPEVQVDLAEDLEDDLE